MAIAPAAAPIYEPFGGARYALQNKSLGLSKAVTGGCKSITSQAAWRFVRRALRSSLAHISRIRNPKALHVYVTALSFYHMYAFLQFRH
jgi:hypothetical protein